MVRRAYKETELKALILEFLKRQGRWGSHYFPVPTMTNWLSKAIKKNGTRVKKAIRNLAKEGYILLHKKGSAISLNPRLAKEINEYTIKELRK